MPIKHKTFAAILVKLRSDAELTLQALADKSGLSKQVIHNYERGRRPTWDAVQALATALGVPTDHFRDK